MDSAIAVAVRACGCSHCRWLVSVADGMALTLAVAVEGTPAAERTVERPAEAERPSFTVIPARDAADVFAGDGERADFAAEIPVAVYDPASDSVHVENPDGTREPLPPGIDAPGFDWRDIPSTPSPASASDRCTCGDLRSSHRDGIGRCATCSELFAACEVFTLAEP